MLRFILVVTLMVIHVQNLDSDWDCDDTEWHVVLHSYVADTIAVEYTDDTTETVALEKVTGNTAHYTWPADERRIADITTSVPDDWDSTFVISHGPCNGTAVVIADFETDPETIARIQVAAFLFGVLLVIGIVVLANREDN